MRPTGDGQKKEYEPRTALSLIIVHGGDMDHRVDFVLDQDRWLAMHTVREENKKKNVRMNEEPDSNLRYKGAILRPQPDGRWRAEINHGGKRHRGRCDTVKDAKAWVDRELPGILEGAEPLTAEESAEYRAARKLLPTGISLLEAVAAFRPASSLPTVTLKEAVEQFLKNKEAAGLRDKSIYGLRWSLNRLQASLGDRVVSTVATSDLLPLLEGLNRVTRDNHRRAWRTFFRWAIACGLSERDPVAAVARLRADDKVPGILTVPQVRKLLKAAEKIDGGSMAAYLALGFFSGIRTAALERIEWSAIKAELIHVTAQIDKLRSARFVDIRPNLATWVKKYRREGRVCPYAQKHAVEVLAKVRKKANIKEWPKNAMRHSFASYLLALVEDSGKVAHELGQRSPDVLFQHYRALVTKKDAEAYFAIMPGESVPKVSQIRQDEK
jgi:site-specific recombinase XerD